MVNFANRPKSFLITFLIILLSGCFGDSIIQVKTNSSQAPSEGSDTAPSNFLIEGVTGSGDSIADSYLQYSGIGTEFATISWSNSQGSSQYGVEIYENDGVTVKCSSEITILQQHSFILCPLAPGNYYRAKVIAYSSGLLQRSATNSLLLFKVNRQPNAVVDVVTVTMDSSNNVLNVMANDADPDGDTLTVVSATNPSNGIVSITGGQVRYTPNTGFFGSDSFIYTISDSAGGQASATINITVQNLGGLAISSSSITIGPDRTWDFNASGGTPPYSFSLVGVGAIDSNSGIYTATKKGGYTTTIRVTDALMATADANVVVSSAPARNFCQPTDSEVQAGIYGIFYDSGGPSGNYSNNEDCSITNYWRSDIAITIDAVTNLEPDDEFWIGDESTPQNSLYATGVFNGSSSMVGGKFNAYFYSDGSLTSSGGEIVWAPSASVPITLHTSDTSLFVGETRTIDVINGTGPFSFQILSGSGSLVAADRDDRIQFVSSLAGNVILRVTDSLGAQASMNLSVIPLGTQPVSLSGCPIGPSPTSQVFVTASGADIVGIKYRIADDRLPCEIDYGYSAEQAPILPIMEFVTNYSGLQKLCVQSRHVSHGWLPMGSSASCSWERNINNFPKLEFSKSIQFVTESNQTINVGIVTTTPLQRATTLNYHVSGTASPGTDYLLTSGSIVIPAGQSTAQLDFPIYDNFVINPDKTVILTLTSQDNADAKLGGRVELKLIIKDNESASAPVISKIAVGSVNSCAIMSDKSLKCWGSNRWGQLGVGYTSTTSHLPLTVFTSDTEEVSIAYGLAPHGCAVKSGGSVWCWGSNSDGQIGDNSTSTRTLPVQVIASGAQTIVTGPERSCAVMTDGKLFCWGRNSNGQLGDGTTSQRRIPTQIFSSDTIAVTMGINHTCALRVGGEVWCWGQNFFSLGDGVTNSSSTPLKIISSGAIDLASSSYETCVRFAGGEVKCWGSTSYYTTPTTILNSGADKVVVGDGTICILMMTGDISCQGSNAYRSWRTDDQYQTSYSLGSSFSNTLVQVNEGSFSDIDFRFGHICGLKTNGSLLCWGRNQYGQLGAPSSILWSPRKVDPAGYEKIAGNKLGTMCGLTIGGALDCWGTGKADEYTSLIVPSMTVASMNKPYRIFNSGVQDLFMGGGSICILNSSSKLICWGRFQGKSIVFPKQVFDANVTKASLSEDNNCAVLASGELKCWSGYIRGNGQVNSTGSHVPITIFASGVKDVSTAGGLTCAVMTSGSVNCWGSGVYFRIGNGSNLDQLSPVQVIASGVETVSVGASAACAIYETTGQLRCWGANQFGAVGDGTVSHKSIPTQIFASGVKQVMSADSEILLSHTCIVQSNDTVQCFGTSRNGQIGNGNWTDFVLSPYTVPGISNAKQVITFGHRSCALITNGDIYCWGENSLNEFGMLSPPTWFNVINGL